MDIISRKDALAQGLTHYFTGKRCKNGHLCPRPVGKSKAGNCPQCSQEANARFNANHPEKRAEYNRKSYKRLAAAPGFLEDKRQYALEYFKSHADERRAYVRERGRRLLQESPVERARQLERSSLRQRGIRHVLRQLSPAQRKQTHAAYQLADTLTRNTGVLYHVDHHIPLSKGGLHVPENLWVITADENLRKGARLPA